ncbi:LrgB family protein [Paenibacillus illinoisensis]|uniref:Putative murein hydrolase export regulator n=1 Tax=Paenibacillus illinoisensis TaxID=59845 RepID=A0A2W0CRV6_9BACL|nr:LrgB family protein [Paenibacillus illinoisensis]PYY30915.1 putative murein hydrolase export regulator [Paenibacillus illinoisensis]
MSTFIIGIAMIALTVVLYIPATRLYKRIKWPILMPVLTTTAVIVVILLITGIKLDTYMLGGKWIQDLLGPAVVSLAFPLSKHMDVLKRNIIPILGGTLGGSIVGMFTGASVALLLGYPKDIVIALLPKSVTTPVAIQLADQAGGNASFTSLFVMIAGFSGILLGPLMMKWIRIKDNSAYGIGLGSASHALGMARSFEYGENAVALSSVSMIVSAIAGSLFLPLWVFIIYS